MVVDFTRLAERRILAAQAEGKLEHLEGEGKPLPARPETPFVDPLEAVGMKLMAEAGFMPREVELAKEIEATRKAYRESHDPAVRAWLMQHLADLTTRHGIAREARLGLFRHH